MLLDVSALRYHRDFRLVYVGQLVSFLGSMMTFVAVPYQVFQLTRSSFYVGLLSTVQLVPLLLTALWGGAYSDVIDRRKMLIVSELILAAGSLVLAINSWRAHPGLVLLFTVSGLMSAVNGFHRPALDALTPLLVSREELPSVSALNSLRSSVGQIVGPALAGICIARFGVGSAYVLDAVSFGVAISALSKLRPLPLAAQTKGVGRPGFASILEGLRYAMSRAELVGTYVVDLIAMTFAMPMALFPALAVQWGGAKAAGWLYSAMSIGSLGVVLMSGWTSRLERHGAAVSLAAASWGAAIVLFGYAGSLPIAVACLALAGASDTISGIFRGIIWNETIPTQLRGRLSSVEMISYMTGPLLGNTRAGWVASVASNRVSIVSGGVLCMIGVLACIPALPGFWRYRRAPIGAQ